MINKVPYSKGSYEVYLTDLERSSPQDDLNENRVSVGIRHRIKKNVVIQNPISINSYLDASDTPYAVLDTLLTDIEVIIASSSSGGTGGGTVSGGATELKQDAINNSIGTVKTAIDSQKDSEVVDKISYLATTAGTGYSVGDKIYYILEKITTSTGSTFEETFYNVSTSSLITPTITDLEEETSSIDTTDKPVEFVVVNFSIADFTDIPIPVGETVQLQSLDYTIPPGIYKSATIENKSTSLVQASGSFINGEIQIYPASEREFKSNELNITSDLSIQVVKDDFSQYFPTGIERTDGTNSDIEEVLPLIQLILEKEI